jgi:hypothetical protein
MVFLESFIKAMRRIQRAALRNPSRACGRRPEVFFTQSCTWQLLENWLYENWLYESGVRHEKI